MPTLARLITLLRPDRWKIGWALLGMVIASCGFLALPIVVQQSLGAAITQGKLPLTLHLCWVMLGSVLVLAISAYVSFVLLFDVAHELTARLRCQYVDQILRVPVAYHRDTSAGEVINRLVGSIADVEWFIKFSLGSLLGVILLMVGGTIGMLVISWKLALLVTCATAPISLGLRYLDRRAGELHRKRSRTLEWLIGYLHELILGIEVVKAFNAESREGRQFADRQARLLGVQRKESFVNALMEPILITAAAVTFMVVLFYGGNLLATRELTPEQLITFLIYLMFVLPNTRNLGLQLARWRQLRVALDRLEETWAITREHDSAQAVPLPEPVRGAVEFCHVAYRYANRELVMDDASFRIAPGECVGVVGESGAGKTTLFNLLLRFYQPQQGSVRVDGMDVAHLTLTSLRGAIAYVPQDTLLFDDTIMEDVRYGRPQASDDEVRTVCRAAQTAEFIETLPDGYRTIVGSRGLKLSGGQRQRLAIARALLKNAPILLLDEATSSLDAQTERQLRDALNIAAQGRTTLIIAHRLATVIHLPRILVLSGGRILEDGTHEELLQRCAAYRTFVATQLIHDN